MVVSRRAAPGFRSQRRSDSLKHDGKKVIGFDVALVLDNIRVLDRVFNGSAGQVRQTFVGNSGAAARNRRGNAR